ncbi:C40 family peptidase [Amylibacter sp.]|nr:C40 family peptidase [Amylibacter sp.]
MNNILQVCTPVCNILDKPNGNLERQMLFGDGFECGSNTGEWVKGKRLSDGYKGYVKKDNLKNWEKSTNKICSFGAQIYKEPNIKTVPLMNIPFQSEITVVNDYDDFFKLNNNSYIHKMHTQPISIIKKDYIETAKKYLGVPYLWGGNSQYGVDCSGLVSLALRNAGYTTPGDSFDQEKELGNKVPKNDYLKRGDLIFWKGHVGLMVDEETLLHANGHHMKVVLEPLFQVKKRIKDNNGGLVLSVNRLII